MVALVTRSGKGTALTFEDGDANWDEIERRTGSGWKDMTAALSSADVPVANAPVKQIFGPSGLRKEYTFAVDDYIFCEPFHVNHDIKIGGKAYPHVHWSTNGTSTNTVKWEFQIVRALGHNQDFFDAGYSVFVEQAANGAPWRHMVAEVSLADALTLTEPDELILITLKRVTNGGTDNPDQIFGLTVDLHYESDRDATPNKAPNFYA